MNVNTQLFISVPFIQTAITQRAPISVYATKDTLMLTPTTLESIVQVRLCV